MPVRNAIWTVGQTPRMLVEDRLPSELVLEQMIVAAPRVLSDEWMLIGRQERTRNGGFIDLLALAPDGALILIELKRDRTPREVVAQAIDYASWVEDLEADEIAAVYSRFTEGRNLADDFMARFGQPLDEDELNQNHEIVIVATQLDVSSERIVEYLSRRGIPINVLCFQVFSHGGEQLLSRTWLMDPAETQVSAAVAVKRSGREQEPWNGEFYASFGHGDERNWDESRRYGFISAGGGSWYSNTLNLLSPGDRVWVKVPGKGFVGVAEVTGSREPISEFKITEGGKELPALEALRNASYLRENADDVNKMEYIVPVRWIHSVSLENAVQDIGMFGNQNTVCKPTTPKWRTTVERLKERWKLP